MLVILLAHAIAAAMAPVLVHRWGRLAFYPLALVPARLADLGGAQLARPGDGARRVGHIPWVPELSMNIDLRFDTLAAIMSVLVLGDRRAGAVLLRRLLPPSRRAHREPAAQLRRRAGRVLRRHVRPGHQRQHAAALHVLGTDHGAVVPARRPLRRTCHQPARRHAGAAGHHRRRAGDAGRHHHPRRRPGARYLLSDLVAAPPHRRSPSPSASC